MMNFDEFKAYVVDNIKDYLPGEYENAVVTLNIVTKNCDVEMAGINIRRPDSNISPNIYLERFFEEYADGLDLDMVMEEISEVRVRHELSVDFDIDKIMNYESAKENITCKVINAERSKQYLADKPHMIKEDLAIVYMVDLGEEHAGGRMTAPITDKILESYGIDLKELHAVAMDNISKEGSFMSMSEAIFGMMGPEAEDMFIPDSVPPMYVLSNDSKINGSAQLFNQKIMDEIATRLGGDFVILPSSIHEVIILPIEGNAPMDRSELEKMIRDVNSTQVAPDEQLSDYPYQYDSKTHEFARMDRLEDRDKAMDMETQRESVVDKLNQHIEELKNEVHDVSSKIRDDMAL